MLPFRRFSVFPLSLSVVVFVLVVMTSLTAFAAPPAQGGETATPPSDLAAPPAAMQMRVTTEPGRGATLPVPTLISAPPSLTLDDCLTIALKENRVLSQSKTRVQAAEARHSQVRATQLPAASAQVSNSHYDPATSATSKDRQDVRRISITETISPFGRYSAQKQAALASVRSAKAEVTRVEIDTAYQVTRAFYDLLLAKELQKVASESVDQITRHRDNTRALVEAGSAPRFDLIRAEVQLANAQPTLIKATHAMANAMADLLNVVGLDPSATPGIEGAFPEAAPSDLPLDQEEALRQAMTNRPDLKGAQAAAEASRQSLKASRRALQPSVQVSQSFEENRGQRAPLESYKSQRLTQLALVFPFLDSGLSRAQSQEAAANLEQNRLQVTTVVANLSVEVRKAISGLKESFEVLRSQSKNVEQALEALSIAEKAYQTGAKTALDVLDAQLALTQARSLRFQALRDQVVALAQFEKALGYLPGFFFARAPENIPAVPLSSSADVAAPATGSTSKGE